MTTYTSYKVISSDDVKDLSDKVNEALAKGWQPTGGIAVAVLTDKKGNKLPAFLQALVK